MKIIKLLCIADIFLWLCQKNRIIQRALFQITNERNIEIIDFIVCFNECLTYLRAVQQAAILRRCISKSFIHKI